MKRNDFATFIVYVAMFGLALLVGLMAIKPIIDTYNASMPINAVVIMILGLLVGAVLNGVLLELGHNLGAKVGKYDVYKTTIFGLTWKKENGKTHFGFSGYDGLTGETKVTPKDPKESTLSAYIFFPVLFFIVEVIVCMVIIVICGNMETRADNPIPSMAWLHVFAITILTVGGMVFIYDLFPAHIDAVTDGFLLVLLAKPANKEAYNNMLLADHAVYEGKPLPETPVYEDLTDFTVELNMLTVYRHLSSGEDDKALPLLEAIIVTENPIAKSSKIAAKVLKLTILLERKDKTKGKALYGELEDEVKSYIAEISTLPSLRAYALIASFVEGSESEANYAIDKAEKCIKSCPANIKDAEKSLLQFDVDAIREAHPSWDVYPLPWEEKKDEEEK